MTLTTIISNVLLWLFCLYSYSSDKPCAPAILLSSLTAGTLPDRPPQPSTTLPG